MEVLSYALAPVLYPMRALFLFLSEMMGAGAAVLLLAAVMAVLLLPLRRWGRAYEQKLAAKVALVRADERQLDAGLRGEARFNAMEEIYQRHGFHPAQNILSGMSFIVQLPFLLAALLLFTEAGLIDGQGFWLLADLSKPDALAGGINALPLLLLVVSGGEAFREYANDKPTRNKFLLITFVLCALIYPLPSALVLYWMTLIFIGALIPVARRFIVK